MKEAKANFLSDYVWWSTLYMNVQKSNLDGSC